MRSVPVDKLMEYAVEDADVTYQLKNIFEPRIKAEGLGDLSANIEMPLISVLADNGKKWGEIESGRSESNYQ